MLIKEYEQIQRARAKYTNNVHRGSSVQGVSSVSETKVSARKCDHVIKQKLKVQFSLYVKQSVAKRYTPARERAADTKHKLKRVRG